VNIFFGFFVGGWVGCVMWFVSSFFGAIRFCWGLCALGKGKVGGGRVGVEMGGGWGAQWEGVEGFVLHCCIVGIGVWLMG
jgi:hypothetical protein